MSNGQHSHTFDEIDGLPEAFAAEREANHRRIVLLEEALDGMNLRLTRHDARITALETTDPEPDPWTPRFAGDPGPGRLLWGAAVGGNSSPVARHEQPAGVPLGLHRTFVSTWNRAKVVTLARTSRDAGRTPWPSLKMPSWPTVAAGTYDAELRGLIRGLKDLVVPVWFTAAHEPENDGGTTTAAAWCAMQRKLRQIIDEEGATNVALVPILMSWTFNPASGRNPVEWYPGDGVMDAAGIDFYVKSPTTERLSTIDEWDNVRAFYEQRGVPIAIGEWGFRGVDFAAGEQMRQFHGDCIADGVVGMAYFDSGLNVSSTSWELKGAQLSTFHEIMRVSAEVA